MTELDAARLQERLATLIRLGQRLRLTPEELAVRIVRVVAELPLGLDKRKLQEVR